MMQTDFEAGWRDRGIQIALLQAEVDRLKEENAKLRAALEVPPDKKD